MKTKLAIAILALTACPLAVASDANKPSFDYFGGAVVVVNADDENLKGLGAEFSSRFNNNWFFMGNFATAGDTTRAFTSNGPRDLDIDLTTASANFGYLFNTTESATGYVFAGVVYGKAEASITGIGAANEDDTGYSVGLGYRSRVSDTIELDGRVESVRLMDETDVQFSARASYFYKPNWSTNLSYSFIDSDNATVTFGVSYHF